MREFILEKAGSITDRVAPDYSIAHDFPIPRQPQENPYFDEVTPDAFWKVNFVLGMLFGVCSLLAVWLIPKFVSLPTVIWQGVSAGLILIITMYWLVEGVEHARLIEIAKQRENADNLQSEGDGSC